MRLLRYKDYVGSAEVAETGQRLRGKLLHITDLITYEGDTVGDLETAFREAVDDYLDTCKEVGKEAQRPYKGTFNVRIPSELHSWASTEATNLGISLNELVKRSLEASRNASRRSFMFTDLLGTSLTLASTLRARVQSRTEYVTQWTAAGHERSQGSILLEAVESISSPSTKAVLELRDIKTNQERH